MFGKRAPVPCCGKAYRSAFSDYLQSCEFAPKRKPPSRREDIPNDAFVSGRMEDIASRGNEVLESHAMESAETSRIKVQEKEQKRIYEEIKREHEIKNKIEEEKKRLMPPPPPQEVSMETVPAMLIPDPATKKEEKLPSEQKYVQSEPPIRQKKIYYSAIIGSGPK